MTDLTDRMRTCAAYLCGAEKAGDGGLRDFGRAIIDATDLLIEASNVLEAAAQPQYPPGVPMEIIEPSHTPIPPTIGHKPSDFWIAPGGPLPGLKQSGTISPRACPKCDSRVVKRVRRIENKLMIECPVCAETWEFK